MFLFLCHFIIVSVDFTVINFVGFYMKSCHNAVTLQPQGLHLTEKTLLPKNLPPKMAAAFHGLITNAGLMAAAILRKSRRHCCVFTYDVSKMADRVA